MHIPSPHRCTCSLPSARLVKARQGKAWLAWYGMVWSGVLAPNHSKCLVESTLLQNCMIGFSQIFL